VSAADDTGQTSKKIRVIERRRSQSSTDDGPSSSVDDRDQPMKIAQFIR
jgi:hypothetical protein